VAIATSCSTYDDGLLQDAPSSGGGSGGDDSGAGGGAGDTSLAGATSEGGAAASAGAESGGAPQAGTGGNAGTSSQGGSAGTPNMLVLEPIDNFEDGTISVAPYGDRLGTWYLFNDGSAGSQGPTQFYAVLLPVADMADRPGSQRVLHVNASGYAESGVGADFAFSKAQYNALAYAGVHFWAKVGASAVDEVRVRFLDVQTLQKGMQCSSDTDAGASGCGDHYGKSVTLTTSWEEYTVLFEDLSHAGTGNPGPGGALDSAHVYSIEFAFGSGTVDFWLDDLSFIED